MTAAGEGVRRGRRRRRGRRPAPREAAVQDKRRVRRAPEWRWRTFPVLASFVAGALLILLIAPETNTALYTTLFFVFLGGAGFCLAHVATQLYLARRR